MENDMQSPTVESLQKRVEDLHEKIEEMTALHKAASKRLRVLYQKRRRAAKRSAELQELMKSVYSSDASSDCSEPYRSPIIEWVSPQNIVKNGNGSISS